MDKLKEIWEFLYDKFFKVASKFDGISEMIFEKTGAKINVGVIVMGIVLFIFVIIFVRAILGLVMHALATGDYTL